MSDCERYGLEFELTGPWLDCGPCGQSGVLQKSNKLDHGKSTNRYPNIPGQFAAQH
jgi:hypothetical protein